MASLNEWGWMRQGDRPDWIPDSEVGLKYLGRSNPGVAELQWHDGGTETGVELDLPLVLADPGRAEHGLNFQAVGLDRLGFERLDN